MKIQLQWATKDPQPWQEIDSSQWATLPKKDVPKPGQFGGTNNQLGWLRNVSVQGITAEGYDHVAIEDIVIGLDAGVRYTLWNDDPVDYPVGERQAIVWTILPLAPDPQLGMAINTRQSCIRYCEGARYTRLMPDPPLNTTVRPWTEFVPPAAAITRHGIWLTDTKWQEHVTAAPQGYWSWAHWNEHLPNIECELDASGRRILKEQRAQGRYRQAQSTITYYQRDTNLAQGWILATHEDALELTTAASATETITTNADAVNNAWAFASPANEPNSADWPNGDYHSQLNCTAASGGLVYGVTDFARVDSTLGTAEEGGTVLNGNGDPNDFSGTGLKLSTVTWNPAASDATDRFVFRTSATGDSHGDAITLTLNTTDSYADGPWSSGSSVALTTVLGTGSPGTFGVTVSKAITGNAATGAVGTLGTAVSYSAALTSVLGTGDVGSFGKTVQTTLSGNVGTSGLGSVAATISSALTGFEATGAVGSLGTGVSYSVALTSVLGTGAIGNLGKIAQVSLLGNAGTSGLGSLAATISSTLSGLASTGAVGSLGKQVATTLSGNVGTGNLGSFSALISKALIGFSTTGAVGSISATIAPTLSGVVGTGAVGNFAKSIDISLSGTTGTGNLGSLLALIAPPITGVFATGNVGILTVSVGGGGPTLTYFNGVSMAGGISQFSGVSRPQTASDGTKQYGPYDFKSSGVNRETVLVDGEIP